MKDIEQKAVKYNFQLYLQLSPPCDLNRKEENQTAIAHKRIVFEKVIQC